jgi:anti-sigma B factor antagonist
MSLEIQQREREGVTIVDLRGRITVGLEASKVRARLQELAAAGARNVILNLADVDYIDSTGLGALVVCYTSLRKLGGRLKLENLSRRNVELLVFTKLATVFELFNDEQDAVNSFFPDRQIKHFDILSFVREQTGEGGESGG